MVTEQEVLQIDFNDGIFQPPTVGEMTSIQAGVDINQHNGELSIDVQSPNKFPSTCVATFDIRTVPGHSEIAFEEIGKLASEMGVKISHVFDACPAGYTDPNERIVQIAIAAMSNPELVVSQGAADLGFLTTNGVKAVIIGPGEKTVMHQPDEYTYISQLTEAKNLYKAIIDSWMSRSRYIPE